MVEDTLTVIDITKENFLKIAVKHTDKHGFSRDKEVGNFSILSEEEYSNGIVKRFSDKDITHFDIKREDASIIVNFYRCDAYGAARVKSGDYIGSFIYDKKEYN